MDAITYFKTKNRMCLYYNGKGGCPLMPCHECAVSAEKNPEESVAVVEKWLAEHPPITYASKMREVFPDFKTSEVCLADILGFSYGDRANCDHFDFCEDCWKQEYGSLGD